MPWRLLNIAGYLWSNLILIKVPDVTGMFSSATNGCCINMRSGSNKHFNFYSVWHSHVQVMADFVVDLYFSHD